MNNENAPPVESIDSKVNPETSADASCDVIGPAPDLDAGNFSKLNSLLDKTLVYSKFIKTHLHDASSGSADVATPTSPAESKSITSENPSSCSANLCTTLQGGSLREYQKIGVNWLISLYKNGINGILADEMGLGKTVTTLSFLAHLWEKKVIGPFLIVAPLSTLTNWQNEITKWCPFMPTTLYHGSREERSILQEKLKQLAKEASSKGGHGKSASFASCVMTSYDIAIRDIKFLRSIKWKYLVVDEAHRLKNFDCKLIKELKRIVVGNRLLLTGTPLQNNLSELWSLLNFILPDIFDDLDAFKSWFHFDEVVSLDDCAPTTSSGDSTTSPTATSPMLPLSTTPSNSSPPLPSAPEGPIDSSNKSAATSEVDPSGVAVIHSEQQLQIISKLHEVLRPFMLRRLKQDVGLDLPQKREIVLYCAPTTSQMEKYEAIRCKSFEAVADSVADPEPAKRRNVGRGNSHTRSGNASENSTVTLAHPTRVLNTVMQLRKICNHPFLFNDFNPFLSKLQKETIVKWLDYEIYMEGEKTPLHKRKRVEETVYRETCPYDQSDPKDRARYLDALVAECGKFALLHKMLPALKEKGHKVLLFSQMTTLLDLLQDYLEIMSYSFRRIDGSVPGKDRQIRIDQFNQDESIFIFLLSTRAGGLGINLTAADTVIIYDSDWNPQVDLQAQDRCHRIGQTRPVCVYRIVTANTVESYLLRRATQKLRLEHLVIAIGRFGSRDKKQKLSLVDLEEALTHTRANASFGADIPISDDQLKLILDRAHVMALLEESNESHEDISSKKTAEHTLQASQAASSAAAPLAQEATAPRVSEHESTTTCPAVEETVATTPVTLPLSKVNGFEVIDEIPSFF